MIHRGITIVACLLWMGAAVSAMASSGGGCDDCSVGNCLTSSAPISREPLLDIGCLGKIGDALKQESDCWTMPIGAGGQHWFTEDLRGDNDGYGIPGLRGTYFWYLTADPQYTLASGNRLGGHVELRLRERDKFRSFFADQVWTYEAYVSLASDQWGTLKAGQIWKRFGMDWDGVWWGNAAYFDGFKLDPDYGLSWERTTQVDQRLEINSFVQFFFHEDRVNGSFPGADPESAFGYTERNTGVVRVMPRWTFDDGSRLDLGMSGLVGEIDSRIAGIDDQVTAGYALDLNYFAGPWRILLEAQQYFGRRNPVNWISGGPSNRVSNFLTGLHYTRGSVTYRGNYSASLDSNPAGVQNLVVTGVTVAVTKNIDFYFDYVNQQISGNANPASNGHLFNSVNFIVHWHL